VLLATDVPLPCSAAAKAASASSNKNDSTASARWVRLNACRIHGSGRLLLLLLQKQDAGGSVVGCIKSNPIKHDLACDGICYSGELLVGNHPLYQGSAREHSRTRLDATAAAGLMEMDCKVAATIPAGLLPPQPANRESMSAPQMAPAPEAIDLTLELILTDT